MLEVEGWAESIPPYHEILAPWDGERTFFNGAFHFSCVRAFDRRSEFRQSIVDWLTTTERLLTVRGTDGVDHEISRPGLGYTDRIADLPSGQVYEDPRFNQWVFVEWAGPCHFVKMKAAETLGHGGTVRGDDGGRMTVLPTAPGPGIAKWALPRLLDFLDVRDLYQDLVDDLQPEYEFWDGGPGKAGYVLEYSLSAIRPIPEDVIGFFSEYIPEYIPKRLEDA
ncbi:hypothetical protein JK358_12375 [Nocardia sp. 2]|uniref:Uncharacterized protein n=1 Tax=Nocardia acididurans TaxID=2802282 RepID=A0ABS1M7Q5_9NOCA|nr:hypothetical protein [Nocardia acididurans]MBL1075188.1 hypothetical protein [Nocardia acididurans]